MQPLWLPAVPGSGDSGDSVGSVNHGHHGARFAVLHRPVAACRGLVVYAHPFAEEMNKSRRMAALAARAMAGQGWAVLMPDLLGCGDSPGDFGDATWAGWVDDIVQASQWLRQTSTPGAPLALWGLRAGALLATAAAARLGDVQRLLLWQPATSGKLVLNQFLRLQMASELVGGEERNKGLNDSPKARLAAGHVVELAGYRIAPALAHGLEQALLPPSPPVRQVDWLEVSTRDPATLAPASASTVAAWQQAGCAVRSQVVDGPAFWQTTEIEDAPALVRATLHALSAALTH